MIPRIVVIIVNWNSGHCLAKCLDALNRQTAQPSKVILIDSAGDDKSLEDLPSLDLNMEVIRLDRNIGFAAANNLGIERATGCQWVDLLNPDAYADERWLEFLGQAAMRFGERCFFASQLMMAGENHRFDGAGDDYHVCGLARRSLHGRASSKAGLKEREVFGACAAAAMYPRAAMQDAGGVDSSYFCYFEGVDLSLRLRLNGYICHYIPQARVDHVGSVSADQLSHFALYHGNRNLVTTSDSETTQGDLF